jgi:NADH dehydrogenase [ubiquinone] 1 alpha subcomplex assembly factor 5
MSDSMNVFDRRAVRQHRARAAPGLDGHDFLFREVAGRLAERLDEMTRKFPRALDLGCHTGAVSAALAGRGGIETLVQCDLAPEMVRAATRNGCPSLAADEEALPFAPASFDLVLSALSLHWVNDLPGTLLQLRQVLKPDGLLLVAMLGGETLRELRAALMEAEIAVEDGASPRVSPFAEVRDAGGLLQRAGFALPMVDKDTIPVTYPGALALMRDLRGMGETNAVLTRRGGASRRATLLRAAAIYEEKYAQTGGRLTATFDVIYLTAWAPAPDQPKALRPGSAQTRLAEALGTSERPAGEKTGPV